MFGTWKYDPETDEVQNLRRAYDPVTARSSQHQACNRCHEKKLKCSGDKAGCQRCAVSGRVCEYTRSGSRSSRNKGKKNGQRSPESPSSSRRQASGSPSSLASSYRAPSQPRSRASSSRTRPSTPAEPASGGHARDRPSDPLGFPMPPCSQLDAFGINALAPAAPGTGYASPSMSHFFQPQQQEYQHAWTADADADAQPLDGHHQPMNAVASTTLSMDLSYLETAGGLYGAAGDYQPYPSYQDFEGYPHMDPRYWPPGPQ